MFTTRRAGGRATVTMKVTASRRDIGIQRRGEGVDIVTVTVRIGRGGEEGGTEAVLSRIPAPVPILNLRAVQGLRDNGPSGKETPWSW